MLYLAYQMQSDMMVPVRTWAGMAAHSATSPLVTYHPAIRNLSAVYELIARAGLSHTRPPYGIGTVVVGNREVEARHFAQQPATQRP